MVLVFQGDSMGFAKYIIRRLILLLVVLFGVSLFTFIISHSVPGDPLVAHLGQQAMSDPVIVQAYMEKWGLDKPLPEQFFDYMRNMLQGDMGVSIASKRPVVEDLGRYFPATFELATMATILAVAIGLILGVTSARKYNQLSDHIGRAISIVGISMPAFWLSLLLLNLFYLKIGIFPGSGRLSLNYSSSDIQTGFLIFDSIVKGDWRMLFDALHHMILPAIVLAASTMGIITRTVRSSMLDVMGQDYLRTARAKGLPENVVINKHGLRNALIPTVTMFGLSYSSLLGGTVVVETIFSYPGLGWYAYNSAVSLDFPAIMGVTVVVAFITAVMNLLVDITYGLIDPRIRSH
jgi:peptide/nickel transport system permease protein